MNDPRVSVLIPAYNAAQYLSGALESVIAQTFSDWEIVLVDDGSTDSTPDIAANFKSKLGDRLVYIRQLNRGASAARNTGLRQCRGELLAILDADDEWLPQHLEGGVRLLDANPEVGLIYGTVFEVDPQGRRSLPASPPGRSGWIARDIYLRRVPLHFCTFMLRRACIAVAGVFDETMATTEDRDWWYRIATHYPVTYRDEITACYRTAHVSLSRDAERNFQNQMRFLTKYRGKNGCGFLVWQQAVAQVNKELADSLLRDGQRTRALRYYARAALHRPFVVTYPYVLVKESLKLLTTPRSRGNSQNPE
jgi:glycosyltransferase involved in cell wall biosynthesis